MFSIGDTVVVDKNKIENKKSSFLQHYFDLKGVVVDIEEVENYPVYVEFDSLSIADNTICFKPEEICLLTNTIKKVK